MMYLSVDLVMTSARAPKPPTHQRYSSTSVGSLGNYVNLVGNKKQFKTVDISRRDKLRVEKHLPYQLEAAARVTI